MAKAKTQPEWIDVAGLVQITDIKTIKPNPDNPRKITKSKMDELVASIKADPEILIAKPLVVDEQLMVLGGNQRLEACLKLGMKNVPTLNATMLTEKQRLKSHLKRSQTQTALLYRYIRKHNVKLKLRIVCSIVSTYQKAEQLEIQHIVDNQQTVLNFYNNPNKERLNEIENELK